MGERRSKKRFAIDMPATFKQIDGTLEGLGRVANISSEGVAFRADFVPRLNSLLTLSLRWPVRLGGQCNLKLIVEGRVLRTTGSLVIMTIERHEFRTTGNQKGVRSGSELESATQQIAPLLSFGGDNQLRDGDSGPL